MSVNSIQKRRLIICHTLINVQRGYLNHLEDQGNIGPVNIKQEYLFMLLRKDTRSIQKSQNHHASPDRIDGMLTQATKSLFTLCLGLDRTDGMLAQASMFCNRVLGNLFLKSKYFFPHISYGVGDENHIQFQEESKVRIRPSLFHIYSSNLPCMGPPPPKLSVDGGPSNFFRIPRREYEELLLLPLLGPCPLKDRKMWILMALVLFSR